MSKSQIDLTQGPLIRKLAILAAPLVAGNVLQTIYNLVDMFWVGRLGANAVAAVAIVFPTQWLLISMAMGVTIAGAALVSQWTGAGRPDMAGFATAQTIVLATTISTILAAIAFAGRYLLLAFLGASGGLYQPTLDYVSVIFWSVPFTFLFMAFTASLQGSGDTVRPMYLAIASNLINVVLDPLLIFGVGPFPAFGVAGAAWATLIARAVAGLVGLALLFSGSLAIHIKVSQLAPDRETMRRLLKIAIPGGVDGAARSFSAVAMVAIVTRFGPITTAAYGIGVRVMSLVWSVSGAIGQSVATGVGQNLGANQPRRTRNVAWVGTGGTFLLIGVIELIVMLFAPGIVAIFVQDPVVIAEGSHFLRISGWGFACSGALMVIQGAFQGAGRTNYSMILSILNRWALRMPLAVFLGWVLGWGPTGIWWSYLFADTTSFTFGVAWLRWGKWQQTLIKPGAHSPQLAPQPAQPVAKVQTRIARQ